MTPDRQPWGPSLYIAGVGGCKHINIDVPVSRADTDLVRALLMMMLDDARPTTIGAITIHSWGGGGGDI